MAKSAAKAAAPFAFSSAKAAFDYLKPIVDDLPEAEGELFTDPKSRAAGAYLSANDPALLGEIIEVIRSSCSRHTARMFVNLTGSTIPGPAAQHTLRAVTSSQLIAHKLPKLGAILSPWLFEKNLCMVHAKRGIGKTLLALAIAFAVASGRAFLAWSAPKPRGVLYIDGEMAAQLMQQRVAEHARTFGGYPDLLRVVTPDLQDAAMPDLGTPDGQKRIDSLVDDHTALIVVDNLSCLVRSGGAENESESWNLVAEWALNHRRAGRAVLFVHHSGKSGAQRGTSKREDLLDVVINLKRPADYNEADGAVFMVEFEKGRSLRGGAVERIEARLIDGADGKQIWEHRLVEELTWKSIAELWNSGVMTLNEIGRELGMNKSTAHRRLVAAMKAGDLSRPYPAPKRKSAS